VSPRPPVDWAALLDDASAGDRRALARLLSAAERGGAEGRSAVSLAYRRGLEADTVGITGAPGSGKSTLVDRLLAVVRADGVAKVGVLAVDPTSPFSGGAILGDRVRMQGHDLDAGVFIRSMATRGHLGGLSVAVPEAVRLYAAAGASVVIVETVGVGQVEVEVASATDTTVVVVNPRWGDAIQANKAGLLETADIFVVNKADMEGATQTRRDLEQMLDLSTLGGWRPPVLETVATTGEGVAELWQAVGGHRKFLREAGLLDEGRRQRLRREFRNVLRARIEKEIDRLDSGRRLAELEEAVAQYRLDPYTAADELMADVTDETVAAGDD
jgi:LAO/AO transport system kinase